MIHNGLGACPVLCHAVHLLPPVTYRVCCCCCRRCDCSLEFGQRLLTVAGLGTDSANAVQLLPADALPEPPKDRHNAYGNSYYYLPAKRRLFVRRQRFDNSGSFMMAVIHAIAHIKADPETFSDANPMFVQEYYRTLEVCGQEMFSQTERLTKLQQSAAAE